MKILENKDYKFVSKEDLFTDKKLGRIAHVINGKTFYRYEDCILSGNALKDKNGIFLAQAIATRPDYTIFSCSSGSFPLIKNFINNNTKKLNIGLIFHTLRDTNFAFFCSSCIALFWYYTKIREFIPNKKISIIIIGTKGGGQYTSIDLAALLQTKFLNDFPEKWYEVIKDVKKTNIIKNKITDWVNKNNYNNYDSLLKPPEKHNIVYNTNYINEIMELLFLNENVEIIPQDSDLSFNYLFVGEKLVYPFMNKFVIKTSQEINISIGYVKLINNINKKINKNKCSNEKFFYLSSRDAMDRGRNAIDRVASKNKSIIPMSKIEMIINNLNLKFKFVCASHYTTIEKSQLFKNGKVFIVEESAAFYNCMFFPKNSIIIVISNQKWAFALGWWQIWNKSCLVFLNHTILYYDSRNEPDLNKFVNDNVKI